MGVAIASVNFNSASQMASACSGAACVVSALAGLEDVIVETQTVLLDAAITAGVHGASHPITQSISPSFHPERIAIWICAEGSSQRLE